jgi:hypothetical protein
MTHVQRLPQGKSRAANPAFDLLQYVSINLNSRLIAMSILICQVSGLLSWWKRNTLAGSKIKPMIVHTNRDRPADSDHRG